MNRIGVLVIDDEPLARERIRTLLVRFPQFELLGECADGRTALRTIQRLRPELVFLDIQMPELDGFSMLDHLPPKVMPAVIFVTAHDQFALRAFEVHAVDYLLKPFNRVRFGQCVERALERLADPGRAESLRQFLTVWRTLQAGARDNTRIAVRDDKSVYFVSTSEVDWIEASGNYVILHARGRTHIVRDSMKKLESQLDAARFVRIHRSAIVNVDRIQRLEPWFHGEQIIILQDGTKLNSSRTFSVRLREILRH